MDEVRVLNTSPGDLRDYFIDKYIVDPIVIDESAIRDDYCNIPVDVRRNFEYIVYDRIRPTFVTGTRITFYVPFSGDTDLFKYRPSRSGANPPRGVIQGNEVVFVYDRTSQDAQGIGVEFERDMENVKKHVAWISSDIAQFNSTIRTIVSQQIDARRQKLLRDRGTVEDLGFPLKRRAGAPTTYASSEVKRRIVPKFPPVSTKPYRPEPIVAMTE